MKFSNKTPFNHKIPIDFADNIGLIFNCLLEVILCDSNVFCVSQKLKIEILTKHKSCIFIKTSRNVTERFDRNVKFINFKTSVSLLLSPNQGLTEIEAHLMKTL